MLLSIAKALESMDTREQNERHAFFLAIIQ